MRDEVGATGAISMSSLTSGAGSYLFGAPGVPAAGAAAGFATLRGKSAPNASVKSATWPASMSTTTMSGSFAIGVAGTSPDVQYQLASVNAVGANAVYRQGEAVQFAQSFKCAFEIWVSTNAAADAIWFFCGSTSVPQHEFAMNSGYAVIFDVYSGFTNGGASGVGTYLFNSAATSLVKAAFATANTWQPVTITYTKGTVNTWVVNMNGADVITYSDPNNASWLASSGTYWGIGARSGGLTGDFYVRRINMSTSGGPVRPPITSGLVGHYVAESLAGSTWYDLSGSANHASTSGTIKTNASGINGRAYAYGGTSATVTFPAAILPATYTLFHICRYNGINTKRILSSLSSLNQNWLSGFHGSINGVIKNGVAFHGVDWITQITNKFPLNMWIMSTDQANLYRANKLNFTTGTTNTGSAIQLGINLFGSELSDWACATVIVYNRALSSDEILSMEDWLASVYRAPISYPPYRMTANTSVISGQPFGNGTYVASASSVVDATEDSWMPFDDSMTTRWTDSSSLLYNNGAYAGSKTTTIDGTSHGGEWLQLQLPAPITINMYSFRTHPTDPARGPTSWVLAGSTDGSTWSLIDLRTGVASTNATVYTYVVLNPGTYNYYRFITKTLQGTSGNAWLSLTELKIQTFSPTTWTPDRITGLQNWHSADAGVTLASNAVSQWNDLSGNGNHLTQATAGYRPSYSQIAVNSNPAVVFGGVAGRLLTGPSAGSGLTQFTIAMVVYTSLNGYYSQFFSTSGTWSSGNIHLFSLSGFRLQVAVNPGIDVFKDQAFTNGVPFVFILTGSISGGMATLSSYVNGTAFVEATGAVASFNLSAVNAGGWSDDVNRTLNGGIQSMIIYNAALSTSDRQTLEGYLTWKWFRSGSSLPAIHPYRSSFAAGTYGSGGDLVVNSGAYRYHVFTSSGTFSFPNYGGTVDVLAVAGGGGGGSGGGGAGGVVWSTGIFVPASNVLTVSVGAGGSGGGGGGSGTSAGTPQNGENSTVGSLVTATGGGAGAGEGRSPAASGGSGGGGLFDQPAAPPAAGAAGQGNAGGICIRAGYGGGGGGGGAGGAGANSTNESSTIGQGGLGGAGRYFIDFANIGLGSPAGWFGGGGGGGANTNSTPATGGSIGGAGGGGNGSLSDQGVGSAAVANTGGGGGGSDPGSALGPGATNRGGSGIVVVRYLDYRNG
jgi:hypothetical protein